MTRTLALALVLAATTACTASAHDPIAALRSSTQSATYTSAYWSAIRASADPADVQIWARAKQACPAPSSDLPNCMPVLNESALESLISAMQSRRTSSPGFDASQ